MRTVDDILCQRKALLLDFDGPICQVFAGLSTADVVSRLRECLADHDVDAPAEFDRNPIELLAWAGKAHPPLVRSFDNRLRDLEIQAVKHATPTDGADRTILAANAGGLTVAIVSNNAGEAVESYLTQHDLAHAVWVVVGREPGRPELLKPNPFPIQRALDLLGVQPSDCVMIGDSGTDVIASRSAGVGVIAYAKAPDRKPALAAAMPDAMVSSMGDIATHLLAT